MCLSSSFGAPAAFFFFNVCLLIGVLDIQFPHSPACQTDWYNVRYHISSKPARARATIRGRTPISSVELPSSRPCKCVRWPCSLSELSAARRAASEGRAQLRLCPVHVLEAPLLMSESPCLCFSSPTLSHLHFSSGSVETALFRLSLTGWLRTCCFPALTPHLPYITLSQLQGTTTATAGERFQLVVCVVFSIVETKHEWTKAESEWIKMCPH